MALNVYLFSLHDHALDEESRILRVRLRRRPLSSSTRPQFDDKLPLAWTNSIYSEREDEVAERIIERSKIQSLRTGFAETVPLDSREALFLTTP